jgi:hypothetical protein
MEIEQTIANQLQLRLEHNADNLYYLNLKKNSIPTLLFYTRDVLFTKPSIH